MILSGHSIRERAILSPLVERQQHLQSGCSYGLSVCGYDIRLDQDVDLVAGRTTLASSLEEFAMPLDVVGIVHDKSTWARRGLSVQNTVLEAGWHGFLTLEILFSPLIWTDKESITLVAGTPIAQVIFHQVDRSTAGYSGKYMNQERGPQEAR